MKKKLSSQPKNANVLETSVSDVRSMLRNSSDNVDFICGLRGARIENYHNIPTEYFWRGVHAAMLAILDNDCKHINENLRQEFLKRFSGNSEMNK